MGGNIKIAFAALWLFAALVSSSGKLLAQPGTAKTQRAVELHESGDLTAAREQILEALKEPAAANDAYSWYVKGFIYKELYKRDDQESRNSHNREISVDAILKAIQLDSEDKLYEYNRKALKYLAQTYFNDALLVAGSLNKRNDQEARKLFGRYKELLPLYEPQADVTPYEVDFLGRLASGYRAIYHNNRDSNYVYLTESISCYENILRLNNEHYTANYNIAISYYNLAAYRISKIDYQTEIFDLIVIQDECLKQFRQSLPYMLKADSLRPDRKETLKGLMAIYLSMNDTDKSDFYKRKLEAIIGGEK